ncbi:hypothetical protein HDZ31DRAFT_38209, partial [Schizophyllum fasciatum]
DPASIKALLDRLRESDEWQKVSSANVGTAAPSSASGPSASVAGGSSAVPLASGLVSIADGSLGPMDVDAASLAADPKPFQTQAPPASNMPSVADLLSQLQSVPPVQTAARQVPRMSAGFCPPADRKAPNSSFRESSEPLDQSMSVEKTDSKPPVLSRDVRSLNYAESLAVLGRLSSDTQFLAFLRQLKREQDELERRLATEREAIRKKHEEKVRVAKTKATMIGAGISAHEADMMQRSYRKDLDKFDRERARSAWQALVSAQQAALEKRAVPSMFVTSTKSDLQRQKRVISVLEDMMSE